MEQHKENQFSDISHKMEIQLQNGSNELLNQIKNCNTLEKKISIIHNLVNLRNENDYFKIINGIINGMLFDENMTLDNYFNILYSINLDSFKMFIKTLLDVLYFSKLGKDKYEKIYQIFEKLIKNNIDKNDLIDLLILICRNFYPGQELIFSIISNNNNSSNNNDINNHNQNINPNNDGNKPNNYFYQFLLFIKSNLNFIFENDKDFNITGIIFIKILRLLSETHIYHHIYKLGNNDDPNNLNNNASNLYQIADTYQKIGFNEQTKKIIGEIYDIQIDLITKIYKERKEKIFNIGRELIRHLIPLGNSNIEIIKTIFNDLLKDNYYDKVLNLPYSERGVNIYAQINIPPLMERMLIYLLTNVRRASGTYTYYLNWIMREFHMENCIENTILVDISRYIVTNYSFYNRSNYVNDYIPRWLILSYILKKTNNHILSSELKQALFFDLILFDKDRDDLYLVDPSILSIMINMKDFPYISEELIEYLDSYAKHFDNNNSQKRINSISEAFKVLEEKEYIINVEKTINESKMDDKFKKILLNLIRNTTSINSSTNANTNNNSNDNSNKNNNTIARLENLPNNDNNNMKSSKINQNENNKKNNINNAQQLSIDSNNKNSSNISNILLNKQSNNSIKSSDNQITQQLSDKNNEISVEISISKIHVQKETLDKFLSEKTHKNFRSILKDICNYNLKKFGKSDSGLKILDSSYKSLCNSFADFYIKVFKDELVFKDFENLDYSPKKNDKNTAGVYSCIFDYAYDKSEEIKIFPFISDLINKIIDLYNPFILHLMEYALYHTVNKVKKKTNENYNGITFFNQINKNDMVSIKNSLNLFFKQCEDNFLMNFMRDFFKYGGVKYFKKIFFDDEQLLYKIIKNCDLNCINTINMSLMNDKYILIDRKFKNLFKFSIRFSPMEKNIFWNLLFSQRHIPSLNLKDFLEYANELLRNPPSNPSIKEEVQIDNDEFFDRIINSILIIFQKEIFSDINESAWERLGSKCMYMLDFDISLKNYIYQMIDSLMKNYFIKDDDRKKLFYYMVQQYYKNNETNINKLKALVELFDYFVKTQNEINKIEITGDEIYKPNYYLWFSDNITNMIKEIMNKIKALSGS